jgi:hypothetical protein
MDQTSDHDESEPPFLHNPGLRPEVERSRIHLSDLRHLESKFVVAVDFVSIMMGQRPREILLVTERMPCAPAFMWQAKRFQLGDLDIDETTGYRYIIVPTEIGLDFERLDSVLELCEHHLGADQEFIGVQIQQILTPRGSSDKRAT